MGKEMPGRATNPRRRFVEDDDGLALSEYLILLGLLTSGVITAVLGIGGNMQKVWTGWANWYETTLVGLAGPGADLGTDTDATAPLTAAAAPSTADDTNSPTVTEAAKASDVGETSKNSKKPKKEKKTKKQK
jgi:pilus assembly protein Flp/PilA